MTRTGSALIVAVALACLPTGQPRAQTRQGLPPARPAADVPPGPHGPLVFGRTARQGTNFEGRADTSERIGQVTTYRGNVAITFSDAKAVLHADEVVYDEGTKEFTIAGHVHLTLDVK